MIPKPKALRVRANTNRSLFCEYHNGFGHKTEDCYNLRDAVEQLIQEGRLARYITSQWSLRKRMASRIRRDERRNLQAQRISEPNRNQEDYKEVETIPRTINVIAGGFASGSTTKLARKKHHQQGVSSLSATKMRRRRSVNRPLPKLFS